MATLLFDSPYPPVSFRTTSVIYPPVAGRRHQCHQISSSPAGHQRSLRCRLHCTWQCLRSQAFLRPYSVSSADGTHAVCQAPSDCVGNKREQCCLRIRCLVVVDGGTGRSRVQDSHTGWVTPSCRFLPEKLWLYCPATGERIKAPVQALASKALRQRFGVTTVGGPASATNAVNADWVS